MTQEKPMLLTDGGREEPVHSDVAAGRQLKIAIDGPAGAGKSTVAKKVADLLGFLYIDTGAMYRAVTWLALQKNIKIADHPSVAKAVADAKIELKPGRNPGEKVRVFVNGREVTEEVRSPEVTANVSAVSSIPAIREKLVKEQRALAADGSVVLDGRDIGTVVLPDADLKIFLTASPEVRAKRRLLEFEQVGKSAEDYESVLKDIVRRDQKDSNRDIAPLRMADDAVLILSDNMHISEVVSHIIKLCS